MQQDYFQKDMVWPFDPIPGVVGVCGQMTSYHVAVCIMTIFRKVSFAPPPHSELPVVEISH